jgi:hypothetical protein
MSKVEILVLAEEGSHESLGRIVNALEFAKELKEKNHDVGIIFDGAGTTFIPALEKEDHKAHGVYKEVQDVIDGACEFCSKAFGVIDEVKKTDITLLDEFDNHPSLEKYIAKGYQIVTF